MFTSTGFTFDGVHSDDFGLQIADFSSGTQNESFGVDRRIVETSAGMNPIPAFHGFEERPFEFSLTLMSESELTEADLIEIHRWLLKKDYSLFKSDDYDDIYYNVVVVGSMSKVMIGNLVYGIEVSFRSDGPYAWRILNDLEYDVDEMDQIIIENLSNLDGYFYPEIIFELQEDGDTEQARKFEIFNLTDDPERAFRFSNLFKFEKIYVNNRNYRIVSESESKPYRILNFNKNWFRLLPGENTILTTTKAKITVVRKFPTGI